MVEDIGKLNWVKEVLGVARRFVKFVTKKSKVLAMYRTIKDLELVKFSSTRFAMMFLVLKWLVKVHRTLRQMVVSNAWSKSTNSRTQEARDFETYVFSHDFWKNAQATIMDLQPFYTILHLVDKEGCTIGLLYEFLNKIGEALYVGNLSAYQLLDVRQQWLHQWEWFHQPIHVVAFILHLLWRKEDGFVTLELHEGWISYIATIFLTIIDQNAIEDELLQFLQKEG
jgi:hypothetical protein